MSHYSMDDRANTGPVRCDLRSDTVTRPDAGMRAAMAAAEVGDDVYGEDPQVNRLEARLAERLGKEAGLFVPSGTQSNLIAMLSHCGRGEEVITGRPYHVYSYEAAGASVLGGVALDPLQVQADGSLAPEDIRGAVKADDSHHAISRLVSFENTHNGMAIPVATVSAGAAQARKHGLSVHLDGARFFNAITALGCAPEALAGLADTVSVCLSKGLGTPVGSVLVGPADVIARGRRWRKMLGGGMRQSGILAAAGLYALDHNVERLAEDHARAERLAQVLRAYGAVRQDTNMVFFTPPEGSHDALRGALRQRGIRIGGGDGTLRLVLHKDADDAALSAAEAAFRAYFETA